MSNALVISSVTSVLGALLQNSLSDYDLRSTLGGDVAIKTLPPDTIRLDSYNAKPQLNLFLFQISHSAHRGDDAPLPGMSAHSIATAPVALDLHYLITAYGAEELHPEILLDYVICVLDQHPVLNDESIQLALAGSVTGSSNDSAAKQMLADASFKSQLRQLRITPAAVTTAEMSALWSAMRAHYRPSIIYRASALANYDGQA